MKPTLPLVGVINCVRVIDPHPFHVVGDKYLRAVVIAGGQPVGLPALGRDTDWRALLSRLDGILLTGSAANIEPHWYGESPGVEGELRDPARDSSVFALLGEALERELPLFAICRGFEELNVALDGSLHQDLTAAGFPGHQENPSDPLDVQYGPRHEVEFPNGGELAELAASDRATVNSVHGQGIDRLGPGLRVEATSHDGLIEAVSLPSSNSWVFGVQWHPEWRVHDNPLSMALFQRFIEAC